MLIACPCQSTIRVMSTSQRASFPKDLRVHRNGRRLITAHTPDGDNTFTVTYLDPHDTLPNVEHNVPAADVIKPCNSFDIATAGDYQMDVHAGHSVSLYAHGARTTGRVSRRDLSKLADRTATWVAANTWEGGPVTGARLDFKTFDEMVGWTRTKRIAPNGWTVDRFGGWVPVGDRRATTDHPLTPCADRGCDRPATREALCGIHAGAAKRRAANDQVRAAHAAELAEQRCVANRERATAQMWAQRLADTFNVSAVAATGTGQRSSVAINGEALYGLLATAAAELREVGIDLTDLVPIELAADRTGATV